MDGIDKIIEHIKHESDARCLQIAREAKDECERIRTEYFRVEQDAYWKAINAGSKETEKRLARLNELAAKEADRQIETLQREMLDEAFALAAIKLRELPEKDLQRLLAAHEKAGAEEVIASYKSELSPDVMSALFD
jgi:vacuolar-type H+-ATPase subunit E/Vma4